ncbi:MAG TPA: UDP-glucose 6-dehydrogenase [Elusimicrobia bacterium]|nr:MAG: UDP-glucose 6-dehydrogenase [Elusimicrobia bacterium RIFOXYA12_FULL_49_49]OGS10807.1 MAG: UDP-glucose 6-dehydrogenase [Elusimicrobia bacterium RIFOXYB1_FULL_48_9]OGS16823.1 MAG: UDP-glucose 6-dehydrogenase [Elusimicrobia bacterium RIFOXYA2_FULL_47_53]OGS32051.1 MAG: UDP-glucose 6-dehydrogenase [Elusimicrobia bacterium RIFOXYB2_FULL_46_23]HBU69944.1 UDP-glucose 6-dehydrogenase [Elusimicrobiota bacterium]
MRKICVVGTGYVGLVTGACLSDLGHKVICVDVDKSKIAMLRKNVMPIYEPGLAEIVKKNIKSGRLSFSTNLGESVKSSETIFIAVGTPPRDDGSADLSFVETVASQIAANMNSYKLIVDKSTVPVETGEWVEMTIKRNIKKNVEFDVASNPEFLREGSAVYDTFNPDRIVIGVKSKRAENLLKEIYAPIKAPVLVTDIKSAEIIKHASNSYLAMKISYINAVANLCEKTGADVAKVAEGMGMDKRIGRSFLNAGIGFGGFCFPKDLEAFYWISKKMGFDFKLLKEVKEINEYQRKLLVKKIEEAVWNLKGKTIGVLGLAFKPDTDDMRFAPSVDIIAMLQEHGARIQAYDPAAMKKAKMILKGVTFKKNAYDAAKGADCLVIVTEWNEFKELDLSKVRRLLKHPIIIDGRNIFEPQVMKKLDITYKSMGR